MPTPIITFSESEKTQQNSVVRFLFEHHGVRGEITHMHEPVAQLLQHHDYPKSVQKLMLELASAAVLISATLKANGTVTVQMQGGKGPHALRFAFVNIDKDLNFYGSASLIQDNNYTDENTFSELVGEGGVLVISVFPADGNRYQGVVSLDKDSLSASLEDYFSESEQLPTSIMLYQDVETMTTGGLMLQIVSGIENNKESLEHLTTLGETLTLDELNKLSLNECLRRLYWNDEIRVFDPQTVTFHCSCSKERCLNALKALDPAEVADIANDPQGTMMTCHNCGNVYHISQQEIKELLPKAQNEDKVCAVPVQEQ